MRTALAIVEHAEEVVASEPDVYSTIPVDEPSSVTIPAHRTAVLALEGPTDAAVVLAKQAELVASVERAGLSPRGEPWFESAEAGPLVWVEVA